MDKVDSDLVNLHDTQADQTDVTNVHLRSTQEDTRMLEPDVVDRIRELSGQGLGSKRIARELGVSRNTIRRYLAGAMVGFQERPAARRLDGPTLSEVHRLYGTLAEGNTVVIQQNCIALVSWCAKTGGIHKIEQIFFWSTTLRGSGFAHLIDKKARRMDPHSTSMETHHACHRRPSGYHRCQPRQQ